MKLQVLEIYYKVFRGGYIIYICVGFAFFGICVFIHRCASKYCIYFIADTIFVSGNGRTELAKFIADRHAKLMKQAARYYSALKG